MTKIATEQNDVVEIIFQSGKEYQDAFNDVELDVVFTSTDGSERSVPAFWSGDHIWRVRWSCHVIGTYRYCTICSDDRNADLHGQEGVVEVVPYEGSNGFLRHGHIRVASDHRHFEHEDGTPFFWLGDTWWMGLCRRFRWPQDVQRLAEDRVKKGFTVINIVAGLYPDMPPFDERGMNEAGFPWEEDYARINPAYFDEADQRISYLVKMGLVPAICGCWGYFLGYMGKQKMQQHWRYLVARYGAYPVVWGLAGEYSSPFYLSENKKNEEMELEKGWMEMGHYLSQINAFDNPITNHPSLVGESNAFGQLGITNHQSLVGGGKARIERPAFIDFSLYCPGHLGHLIFPDAMRRMRLYLDHEPKVPVLIGEVAYEGIYGASHDDIQRLLFWSAMLSGAAGHTYGANGIWQVNTEEQSFGPSPGGYAWGGPSWPAAAELPGSTQLGIGRKFLERYPWRQFEQHPEWVGIEKKLNFYAPAFDDYFVPYAAGIPGKVRMIYFADGYLAILKQVKSLEPKVNYRAFLFDPANGNEHNLGKVVADRKGNWDLPMQPILHDWVLVLESQ